MRHTPSLTALISAAVTLAQGAPGVPSTAPPPTETPQGDYTGPLRPQVHFSPPVGFMNDPNGMFRSSNGTWHLYYQYNPTDVVAGNQHWGHATSDDLYRWTNHPIALYPPNNESGVFSGSAVMDTNNTSGVFNDTQEGVVAIYTLNTPEEQTQNIAFSYDGGYTFEEYAQNPVISVNSTQFRDPKVSWYEDHWVMVIAFSVDFDIAIYTSPNLIDWTWASNFSSAGLLGLQYECPALERLPIEGSPGEYAWMLYISLNPGAPYGGSIGEYFVGDFNGTHFEPFDRAARIADWGKDNYATQFFYSADPEQEPTSIAWASNWQYTNRVPSADEGWRSIMSLPRHNYLANATRIGWVLGSKPVDLGPVIDSQIGSAANLLNDSLSVDYGDVESGALYFQINLTYPDPLPEQLPFGSTLNFTFSSSASSENVTGGYFFSGGENAGAIWVDRGNTNGFNDPFFTDKFSLTQATPPFAKQIEGVIDRSVIELFLDGGHFSSTNLFFAQEKLDTMSVVTAGLVEGMGVSIGVWSLKSGWS